MLNTKTLEIIMAFVRTFVALLSLAIAALTYAELKANAEATSNIRSQDGTSDQQIETTISETGFPGTDFKTIFFVTTFARLQSA